MYRGVKLAWESDASFTQAAAELVTAQRDSYENVVWADAKKIKLRMFNQ